MQNTIGSHEPALVSPQDFLDRMTHVWSQPPFNMPTSPALLGGWRVMADHYRAVIRSNLSDDAGQDRRSSFRFLRAQGRPRAPVCTQRFQAEQNVDHPNPLAC